MQAPPVPNSGNIINMLVLKILSKEPNKAKKILDDFH